MKASQTLPLFHTQYRTVTFTDLPGRTVPKWQGQLFISTLVDQDVKRVTTDEFGATLEELVF